MTSRSGGHAEDRPPPRPKVQVQRSLSRETITIRFSALGEDEEDEEGEELRRATSPPPPEEEKEEEEGDDLGFVTALEASEELMMDLSAACHSHSPALSIQASSVPVAAVSGPPPAAPRSASSGSSPHRSSSAKSLGLVKSLSTEAEPREGLPVAPSVATRHRQLMKSLVKSLSTDQDSRLNLNLFKPFAQPRVSATAGDSKTAPSSPLASPETRSFFRVSEVEARIEDTKRRLSEVMYEPLQLLSKIMGDEGGGGGGGGSHWPKALSTSVSAELSGLAGLNGHLESNNNYSIKEEEGGDSEGESLPPRPAEPWTPRSPPLALSALARQEDEEFCELYCEDLDVDRDNLDGAAGGLRQPQGVRMETTEEPVEVEEETAPSVPHTALFILTALVYGYFILPLPPHLDGILVGMAAGFLLALCGVWLAVPGGPRHSRRKGKTWHVAHPDIKEPGIFKGWMNEIQNYDPETYHATMTHSVFVRLEGSTLRLSKPNRNIARRATFNEPKPDVTYVSQKMYDVTDCKVYLVPSGLARKRVWNKKYPICIELAKQDHFMSKAEGDEGSGPEEREAAGGGEEAKRPARTQEGSRSSSHRDPTLFLFGRTGREKEEWFRRILLASRLKSEAKKPSGLAGSKSSALPSHSRGSSRGSLDEALAPVRPRELMSGVRQKMLLDYGVYMANCVPLQPTSPTQSAQSSPRVAKKLVGQPGQEDESVAWVNVLTSRILWDFLGEKYWTDVVSKKIQMKLSKIRLPYFMEELTLTELDMGVVIPRILLASKPSVDHQGLWFDLEVSYNGSFLMTLETKMNLARLGKEGEGSRPGDLGKGGPRPRTCCLADSEEESSSAGSSDEEESPDVDPDKNLLPGAESYVGGHKPSKIMRFVDKIAKSKYFQKATETEFIKKKLEEVSNTPLLLTVEVQECRGTLAVNVPPPPTNRIWYGFRSPPHLELKARPKLGEREVTLAHVTDWIEKKLYQEFQKVFVMPNMDDVWLHIMHSARDPRSSTATEEEETASDPDSTETLAASEA